MRVAQALQHIHKSRFPNHSPSTRLTARDIQALLETQDSVDMSSVENVFAKGLSGTPGFSQVKQDIHGLQNDMSKANRLAKTSLVQSAQPVFKGCFKDSEKRDLPQSLGKKSKEACAEACKASNYKYFGNCCFV